MQCRTLVLWWLVNGKEPALLEEKSRTIAALMPLVARLFPGIDYYSATGFGDVMRRLVIPILKKRFVELTDRPEEEITTEATTEVAEVLASDGYEWEDDPNWQSKFEELLAA